MSIQNIPFFAARNGVCQRRVSFVSEQSALESANSGPDWWLTALTPKPRSFERQAPLGRLCSKAGRPTEPNDLGPRYEVTHQGSASAAPEAGTADQA